ncbi:MAG: shikimate kinase [Desulfovibrio sp.]|nr:shikimate kinase [Desulfovibrio sp.]
MPHLMTTPAKTLPCIILIGMAGAGKSTVGKELARELQWAFLDSDYLIEAAYGMPLHYVAETLGKEAFVSVECSMVCSLKASRAVIATGGSVIYCEEAMRHLARLGTIVHLDVPWPVIEARLARNPQRGLAIAPGQTLAELFDERQALYQRWADVSVSARGENPGEFARRIRACLPQQEDAQQRF